MNPITLLDAPRYPMILTGTPGAVTCRVEFNLGRNAKQIDSIRWMVRDRSGETIHADRKRTFFQQLASGTYSVQLTIHYTDHTKSVEMQSFTITRTRRGPVLRMLASKTSAAADRKKITIELDKKDPDPAGTVTRLMNGYSAKRGAALPRPAKAPVGVATAGLKASQATVSSEVTVKVKVGTKTAAKKAKDVKPGDKLAPVRKNKAFTTAQAHAEAIVAFEKNVKALEGVTVKLTPIVGADFKGAIKCLYSAQFPHSLQLEGKRPVVRQLIARLAQVVDPAKVHIVVVDDAGNAVSPSTTLAKLRG